MSILKIHLSILRSNQAVKNFQKITAISKLLIACVLITFLSEVVLARKLMKSTGIETRDDKICGIVRTRTGNTVTLKEEVPLSSEDLEKIHVKKLQNATFQPEKKCAIQVCGFTSYGNRLNDSYIGVS